MNIGLRLNKIATVFVLMILYSCQNKDSLSRDTDSYQVIDLYTVSDEYKFYTLYFNPKTNKEGKCILAYKIAGNPKNSNIQMYFDILYKNLNKNVFPELKNGYILIDNEFQTDFQELNYIYKVDSVLNINYNKKIQKIEIDRNNSVQLHIIDN